MITCRVWPDINYGPRRLWIILWQNNIFFQLLRCQKYWWGNYKLFCGKIRFGDVYRRYRHRQESNSNKFYRHNRWGNLLCLFLSYSTERSWNLEIVKWKKNPLCLFLSCSTFFQTIVCLNLAWTLAGAGFGKNGTACFDNFCESLGGSPINLEWMPETNVFTIVENITPIHKFGVDHINDCCYH